MLRYFIYFFVVYVIFHFSPHGIHSKHTLDRENKISVWGTCHNLSHWSNEPIMKAGESSSLHRRRKTNDVTKATFSLWIFIFIERIEACGQVSLFRMFTWAYSNCFYFIREFPPVVVVWCLNPILPGLLQPCDIWKPTNAGRIRSQCRISARSRLRREDIFGAFVYYFSIFMVINKLWTLHRLTHQRFCGRLYIEHLFIFG